ncbi:MAG: thiamine phosphate synthase [Sphingomonadales bacterium]|jgi:thiamine-phosphate pyrophosphorylase
MTVKTSKTIGLPSAWFLTDERVADPISVIHTLPKNCGVIFRNYNHPNRKDLALKVVKAAHNAKHMVLIAADKDLAIACGADGVHWPKWADSAPLNPPLISTYAVHDEGELKHAEEMSASAVIISPIFETKSHKGSNTLGIKGLKGLMAQTNLPVYAMGGINAKTWPKIADLGVTGFAGIGYFLEKT